MNDNRVVFLFLIFVDRVFDWGLFLRFWLKNINRLIYCWVLWRLIFVLLYFFFMKVWDIISSLMKGKDRILFLVFFSIIVWMYKCLFLILRILKFCIFLISVFGRGWIVYVLFKCFMLLDFSILCVDKFVCCFFELCLW